METEATRTREVFADQSHMHIKGAGTPSCTAHLPGGHVRVNGTELDQRSQGDGHPPADTGAPDE